MKKVYNEKIYVVRTIDIEQSLDERLTVLAAADGKSKRDILNRVLEKGLALVESLR